LKGSVYTNNTEFCWVGTKAFNVYQMQERLLALGTTESL
jgi:hypothetical protein